MCVCVCVCVFCHRQCERVYVWYCLYRCNRTCCLSLSYDTTFLCSSLACLPCLAIIALSVSPAERDSILVCSLYLLFLFPQRTKKRKALEREEKTHKTKKQNKKQKKRFKIFLAGIEFSFFFFFSFPPPSSSPLSRSLLRFYSLSLCYPTPPPYPALSSCLVMQLCAHNIYPPHPCPIPL